ncbi:MAG: TRL domain-containing protein [Bacteroidota bacterium]
MKKIIILSSLAGFLASCAMTVPYTVTNNSLGDKIGTSKTVCLFSGRGRSKNFHGIMLNKNFGIVEAAKNGGITKIGAVDMKITKNPFFVKKEFIVAGE